MVTGGYSYSQQPQLTKRDSGARAASLQALIYVSFVLISCALFSKFWIEAGKGSESLQVCRQSWGFGKM